MIGVPDVVTIGESMACFVVDRDGWRAGPVVIGAESNVASAVAGFGHGARWVSRLGDDALGDVLAAEVAGSGVEVTAARDEVRPTGLAIKELRDATRVRYYRRGSAATKLSPRDVPELDGVSWLHLTGITAAVVDDADALFRHAIDRASAAGTRISFDVNLRPALWSDLEEARRSVLPWCRAADLVLVGDDEAAALRLGDDLEQLVTTVAAGADTTVVRKLGPDGAEAGRGGDYARVRAVDVPVVDVVGAGDAFAAGMLVGALRDLSLQTQLRLGAGFAARVIQEHADVAAAPDAATRAALLADACRLEEVT